MAYRIERIEFMRYKPKWYYKFLMSLPVKLYNKSERIEDAQAIFEALKQSVHKFVECYSHKFYYREDNYSISIRHKVFHTPYVEFKISIIDI